MDDKSPIVSSVQAEAGGSHHAGGLTIVTCAVFIIGEMAGSGVLALPKAVNDCGWMGLVMLLFCCVISTYTGDVLGQAWSVVQDRYSDYRGHVRYPYPAMGQVTFGKAGRVAVTVCMQVTQFGVTVVFLILAAQNLQALVSYLHGHVSFCYWLLIVAACLLPLTMLGTPKDFWPIAVGATVATSIACVLLTANMVVDKASLPPAPHAPPSFTSFFSAFGIICFAFGGHPAFPTFQTDMRTHQDFGKAVALAYVVVLCMYVPVASAGFAVYGDKTSDNVLNTVSTGPLLYIVQILITLHLILSFIIVINPLCQELEEFVKIPKHFTWKRVVSRALVMVLVVFTAESVPHFGAILSLVGGSTVTLLAYVFPSLIFLRLAAMDGDWDRIVIPLHHRVIHYEIMIVGGLAGVASTYSAISALADPHAFTVPCYVNVTAANGN